MYMTANFSDAAAIQVHERQVPIINLSVTAMIQAAMIQAHFAVTHLCRSNKIMILITCT